MRLDLYQAEIAQITIENSVLLDEAQQNGRRCYSGLFIFYFHGSCAQQKAAINEWKN